MPITSQHIDMSYEEWDLLPYQPGWKHEYWDGRAHITPNHQTAVTVVEVTPRQVHLPCTLQRVVPEDESALLAVYLEAFADNQAFCDYTEEQFHEAARKDLRESFTGRRAPLLSAAHVAVDTDGTASQIIGAALISREQEYGPILDLIFIRPRHQRYGIATALAASAINILHEQGERTLTSCYQLANTASQTWHRGFGFVEKPDLRYARAYYRRARQELYRREKLGDLKADDDAALRAEVAYWSEQIDALEHLAAEQGFEAVHPRPPHW